MVTKNKGGRPRINPNGVLVPVSGKASQEDLDLLKELGYNAGQAIREFCNMKREIQKRIKW